MTRARANAGASQTLSQIQAKGPRRPHRFLSHIHNRKLSVSMIQHTGVVLPLHLTAKTEDGIGYLLIFPFLLSILLV